MGRGQKHTAQQIVNLLRQVEVCVANGKTVAQACKEGAIVEQTYYRLRREYDGLKVDQAQMDSSHRIKDALHRAWQSVGERLLRKLQLEAAE